MISDKKLKAQFKTHKEYAYRNLSEQKKEFKIDFDYYAGNRGIYQTGADEVPVEMVNINRVKPFVDAVNGFTIQNRREPTYHASILDNERQRAYSEYTNNLSKYFRQNANYDQVESEQDLDMYICGMGATDANITYNDYAATTDPYGEFCKEKCEMIEEIWWDAAANKKNLTDATYVFRAKKFHIQQATELFGQPEDVFSPVTEDGSHTGKYFDVSTNSTITLDIDAADKDMVNVYYYQWYEINVYYTVPNPLPDLLQVNPDLAMAVLSNLESLQQIYVQKKNGRVENQQDIFDFNPQAETLVIPKDLRRGIQTIFESAGIYLDYESNKRKEFFTAIISGTKVFTKYKNIDQTGFSIKFKTGTYDPNTKLWSGIVKQLREPALFLNKLTTETLNIIAASPKPGLLVEVGVVDDVAKLEEKYALNGSVIEVAAGALSNGQIRDKQIGTNISGYAEMFEMFKQALPESLGAANVIVGMIESKEETATLQRQRVKRALSVFAHYFDSITLYQKMDAMSMLPMMRILAEQSPERLMKITGEHGAVTFQQFGDDEFADRYEVVIGEAPDTDTARQDAIDATTAIADRMMNVPDPETLQQGKQLAMIVYDMLPNVSNDIKRKVTGILTPKEPTPEEEQQQQQQQQMQQQAAMLEMQEKEADIASKLAKTNESEAKVRETESKVVKNLSDSEHTAIETEIMERQGDGEFNNNIII